MIFDFYVNLNKFSIDNFENEFVDANLNNVFIKKLCVFNFDKFYSEFDYFQKTFEIEFKNIVKLFFKTNVNFSIFILNNVLFFEYNIRNHIVRITFSILFFNNIISLHNFRFKIVKLFV